jgi:opacity protein-like surface antigen
MGNRPSSTNARLTALALSVVTVACVGTPHRSLETDLVANPHPAPPLTLTRGTTERAHGIFRSTEPSKDVFQGEGMYVGLHLTESQVLGDFDGRTAVVDDPMTPTQFVFLPETDASPGFGVEVGYRWNVWDIFLSWETTDYDAQFAGMSMNTSIDYLDLMFRRYYRTTKSLQPYLMVGLGWSEGVIENGALDTNVPLTTDAKLKDGVNYNVGAGLALYTLPWFHVYGQAMWRFGRYDSVTGPFGTSLVSGVVDSDAWEISTGASIRILRPRN